jgi:hypothetical protein
VNPDVVSEPLREQKRSVSSILSADVAWDVRTTKPAPRGTAPRVRESIGLLKILKYPLSFSRIPGGVHEVAGMRKVWLLVGAPETHALQRANLCLREIRDASHITRAL